MILTLAGGEKKQWALPAVFMTFLNLGGGGMELLGEIGSSLGRVGKTCLTGIHCQVSSEGTHDTRLPHPNMQFVRKSHKTEPRFFPTLGTLDQQDNTRSPRQMETWG